jgi:hypothetical protein
MSQSNHIADDINAVLTSAHWPRGRTLEQALADIEAVIKLMTSKLNDNKVSVCYRDLETSSGPGPHG